MHNNPDGTAKEIFTGSIGSVYFKANYLSLVPREPTESSVLVFNFFPDCLILISHSTVHCYMLPFNKETTFLLLSPINDAFFKHKYLDD